MLNEVSQRIGRFAALEVATGKITETCTERHPHQEFLGFLRRQLGRQEQVVMLISK
jgi:hypothetical protein